jgi:SET domain-containing protein
MGYRPLHEYLTIKESKIEGLGLFATDEIYEDICLGVTHVHDIRFEDSLIRTPLGGFINHSDNPNCIIKKEEEGSNAMEKGFPVIHLLTTLRNIQAGEELTVRYTTYKV